MPSEWLVMERAIVTSLVTSSTKQQSGSCGDALAPFDGGLGEADGQEGRNSFAGKITMSSRPHDVRRVTGRDAPPGLPVSLSLKWQPA